jgi:hypothetical protein
LLRPRAPRATERLEQERQDREPEEEELESEAQVAGGRAALDRAAEGQAEVSLVWGLGQEGRVPWLGVPVVLGRGLVDQVAEVKLVWGLGQEGRVLGLEVSAVSVQDRARRVAACKRLALGLERATMAARLLCQEWSLVSRGEPQVVAVSQQKKNF